MAFFGFGIPARWICSIVGERVSKGGRKRSGRRGREKEGEEREDEIEDGVGREA